MKEAVKERIKKLGPWIGFPIFYLVCLVVFASWTFPFDKLKERIVLSVNQEWRDTGQARELKIDEVSSSWITGVAVKGIHLITPSSEAGKAPIDTKIDDAHARISILGLLFGNKDVGFSANAFGGSIDGAFRDHGKEQKLEATIDGLDLSQVELIKENMGIPVEGKVSGEVKLTVPEGKTSKGSGAFSLDAKDIALGDGKAKLKIGAMALTLPRLAVGNLTLTSEAKDGVLKLSKLAGSGKDLELQGDGRVQLRDSFGDSLADVNLKFKVADGYKNKNDMTKGLFSALDFDPRVKQSKRTDGFFAWHMRGALTRPDFDPAPAGAATLPQRLPQ